MGSDAHANPQRDAGDGAAAPQQLPDPGDAAKKTRGIGAREELRQALCLR